MKLKRAQVDLIAQRLAKELMRGGGVEADAPGAVAGALRDALIEDLTVEDRLNEEVRKILEAHADDMARGSVQYHEMFKLVKAELVRKRKLIL